ncbi:hypothetical protein [Marinimicrobium sp. LS-A18]|uniref:hypothetical protein n=1 Tax=Marinimicrobium sp. LS-A18 TaxID=1381596 RepID=UPI000465F1F2|nr:hypothetical protein [Marinimicrobium sp. LS-A18]
MHNQAIKYAHFVRRTSFHSAAYGGRYASPSLMKYLSLFLFIVLLSGCAGGHYYVQDDDPNRTLKVLYKDEHLWIAIHAMNGSTSSLMFAARTDNNDVSLTVESVTLSIQADENHVTPTTSTFAPRSVALTKGEMYSMTATYEFLAPPEEIRAHIQLRAVSDGQEISIDEIITLNIVEYGFWGALMSI